MAITKNCSTFLFYAKALGVSFKRPLMLGRLNLYAAKKDVESDILRFKNNVKGINDVEFKDEYSEPLFEILGSEKTESIDFSDYEKATIIHDMNNPVSQGMHKKFSVIVDGGTIEHVFNFPVAIRNCMEMLEVGGHYIGITPTNNLMGHGFYQFSPELYFSIFREENGFDVKKMVVVTEDQTGRFSDWYEVLDPRKAKTRISLVNSLPTYIMVIAEKKADAQILKKTPQQSDYEMTWNIKESLANKKAAANEGMLKYLYRKFTPRPLKVVAHNIYNLFTKQEIVHDDLGKINAEHFRKIDV